MNTINWIYDKTIKTGIFHNQPMITIELNALDFGQAHSTCERIILTVIN